MLCKAFSPLSLPNLQSRVSKARSAPLSIWGCWREQMWHSNFYFKTSISNLRPWASQLLWHRKPSYVVRTKASFLSNGICLKLFCKSRQWGGDCWMAAPLFLRLFVRETNGSLSGGFPGIWGVEEQSWRWNILSKGNLYPPLPYPATTTKLTRLWKKKKKLQKTYIFDSS